MTNVTVSHGSDFFGVDVFDAAALRELGQYLPGLLPAADHPPLTDLLASAGTGPQHVDAAQVDTLAALLRRASTTRGLKKQHSALAARLGIAAATAARTGQPWTWTTETEGDQP
ncbi:hypothetical protein ACIGD1_34440 [Streptomyces sp. NPDC085612]|uniref:DUF7739 domain-containing protein n=1 Tax=Streptomyces sp. NPDC085612 TaxID=3365732 RepID=UPI0037D981AA